MALLALVTAYIGGILATFGAITFNPITLILSAFAIYISVKQMNYSTTLFAKAVFNNKDICAISKYYTEWYSEISTKRILLVFGGGTVLSAVLGFSMLWIAVDTLFTAITWPFISMGATKLGEWYQEYTNKKVLLLPA